MYKSFLSVFAIVVAMWGSLELQKAWGIPNYYTFLFWTAIFLLAVYHELSKRVSSLEVGSPFEYYIKIIAMIDDGDFHIPQHKQAGSLRDGGAIPLFITKEDEDIFEDFQKFGVLFNDGIADCWCIEELKDTNLYGIDNPTVGRQYKVWYKACLMGSMQITIGCFPWSLRSDKSLRPDNEPLLANINIKLNYLRFVPYDDALSFLSAIYLFIGDYDVEKGAYARALARSKSIDSLTGVLWEAVRKPNIDPHFELSVKGTYAYVRLRTE